MSGFRTLIIQGKTNAEIYENNSSFMRYANSIDKLRLDLLTDKFGKEWRDVEVTYIYGPAGSGKTSYIYNHYKPEEFYRVTLYNNSAFDDYKDEGVIVFDEFNSSFRITDMNHYLDRYYISLPARYDNRFSMYTKVYIISNLPLSKQYVDIQDRDPEIYKALLRRIDNIIRIDSTGIYFEKKKNAAVQEEMEILKDEEGLPW